MSGAAEGLTVETMTAPLGDLCYETRLYYADATRPARAALIAPPHPFLGGNFDNNVVTALAGTLAGAGYAVMTYNLPGVGRSTARPGDGRRREAFWNSETNGPELEWDAWDLLRLRDYLLDLTQIEDRAFSAAGYSYGGAVLWKAAQLGRIGRLALVSPPASLLGELKEEEVRGLTLCLFAEDDLAFEGRGAMAVAGLARPGLEVEIIGGADHFFRDHLDAVAPRVLQHLAAAPTDAEFPSIERSR